MLEIEKALRAGGAFSELPLHDGAGNSEIKPPRQNTQIKFQGPAEAEFDVEMRGFRCRNVGNQHKVVNPDSGSSSFIDFVSGWRRKP